MTDQQLIQKARVARKNAYAPYSNFKVSCALLSSTGKVYTGVNVENASYGLTTCAERMAVFTAVAQGERDFEKIAIVTDTQEPKNPCGACLQVLAEFCQDLKIICATVSGKSKKYTLKELLPKAFKKIR